MRMRCPCGRNPDPGACPVTHDNYIEGGHCACVHEADRAHNCPFCAINTGQAPAEFVREWSDAFAIVPLRPVTEGHVLVIPKTHVTDFAENPDVTGATAKRAAQLCRDLDLVHANLITSRGMYATQSVFHLHVHLVPRAQNDGLALPWYSGKGGRRP